MAIASYFSAPSPSALANHDGAQRLLTNDSEWQSPTARTAPNNAHVIEVAWGATPLNRAIYQRKDQNLMQSLEAAAVASEGAPSPRHGAGFPQEDIQALQTDPCKDFLLGIPAVFIGVTLNAMLSVPFGLAFFPVGWDHFPAPRAMGIQMFLFSTVVCQLVFTVKSSFRPAMGMMMVENIPFMHTLAQTAYQMQGPGLDTVSTVMVLYALSTLTCGALFMALGQLKLGDMVYYFPRYVITGCIGGIGVFVTLTGFEVATGAKFAFNMVGLRTLVRPHVWHLWLPALLITVVLNVLLRYIKRPLFPPFYFIMITPIFHIVLLILGVSVGTAREWDWVFSAPPQSSPLIIWEVFDFSVVRWDVIATSIPTMVAMTIFSLMHVPINIPSLCASTSFDANMNQELVAHGWSNLVSGACGGLANYLCYSNSLLYYKCRGGGRFASILLSMFTIVLFFVGPSVVSVIPRCMAGTLLIHLGWCLVQEALIDSYPQYDRWEYFSVTAITVTMTFAGMTLGLGLGVLLSATTFMIQNINHMQPVRGAMRGTTVRSMTQRTTREKVVLDKGMRSVQIVQLQGTLFFGNATVLFFFCERLLAKFAGEVEILVLDFTLVNIVESSAADMIAKIYPLARKFHVALVYNSGRTDGFPTDSPLSEQLADKISNRGDLHVASNLNSALQWVEDSILRNACCARRSQCLFDQADPLLRKRPLALRQLHCLCQTETPEIAERLFSQFKREEISQGATIWKQGELGSYCILVSEGLLISELEEEAGTTEPVNPGALVGEYNLLSSEKRRTTLSAQLDSVVYRLDKVTADRMLVEDSYLMFVLSRICIVYLASRCSHPMNRIWETHSVPI
uniref:Sulfate transporter n=1 Tax=Noctiluca scintillans TaxID=2966 RepID=A0A7S1EYS6_NOCSC|mmetsp:Transcript_18537/g.49751  ORF Transcript_18537/g.49751 Transcript_18537/m.49751 type:complete len:850 (+) Transcript_18537:47-2596(+)